MGITINRIAGRARDLYEEQAKERMMSGVNQHTDSPPVNLPEGSKGDARDQAGRAFGVSGKSVDFDPDHPGGSSLTFSNRSGTLLSLSGRCDCFKTITT
ncbi:hypothetical protein CGZ80_01350 [Rhodopirellula sp. MGV]|nr:hypothetical protein CGZ80_01350 [Rhodopirellula sp. MGV]PNY38293.1 hypothetical protein C2E31_02985 [Rhodopirellula baltica]